MPCLRDREAELRNFIAGLPGHLILTTITLVRITESTMSTEATLTSKGQTTIPKPIRDSLGMKTGDRMSFTLMPDGVVVMRVKNKRVSELAGLLYKKGRKPLPVGLLSR
jgi:antitoxin PrlF